MSDLEAKIIALSATSDQLLTEMVDDFLKVRSHGGDQALSELTKVLHGPPGEFYVWLISDFHRMKFVQNYAGLAFAIIVERAATRVAEALK